MFGRNSPNNGHYGNGRRRPFCQDEEGAKWREGGKVETPWLVNVTSRDEIFRRKFAWSNQRTCCPKKRFFSGIIKVTFILLFCFPENGKSVFGTEITGDSMIEKENMKRWKGREGKKRVEVLVYLIYPLLPFLLLFLADVCIFIIFD